MFNNLTKKIEYPHFLWIDFSRLEKNQEKVNNKRTKEHNRLPIKKIYWNKTVIKIYYP